MLTIMAALESELSGVQRALKAQDSLPVELQVIGIGKERAQASVAKLLDSYRWSRKSGLLLLGFAGGLDPVLKAGDLLLPTCYYNESGDWQPADGAMWQQARVVAAELGLRVVQGNSLTVDQVVRTREEKQELYRRHQVGSVNMEDYWVARMAADARVPFLAVRAILDPVQDALPAYVSGLAGRPARAAFRVASGPWRLPTLVKLAGKRNLARARLTRFALGFINSQLAAAQQRSSAFG